MTETYIQQEVSRGGGDRTGARDDAVDQRCGAGIRLRLHGNPLRQAFSASTRRAAGYLLVYQLVGWALFAAALTATTTAAGFAITLAGVPLLLAAARVVRACANAERARLGALLGEPVTGRYREAAGAGVIARGLHDWKDPATWRDVAYVIGMFVPLAALGLTVLAVWLTLAAGITMPLWYWAPFQRYPHGVIVHGVQLGYFPHGPSGPGAAGIYVDTMPKALLTGVACLVLFALFSYVLVLTARMHASVARALLRAPRATGHLPSTQWRN
jgi:hypothetical protein